ncbi:MAG: hypothetical protein RLZZ301_1673 [Bacteroidota bacterium]
MMRTLLFLFLLVHWAPLLAQQVPIVDKNGMKCYQHTIQDGQTLFALQEWYACPAEQILALNPGIERGLIAGDVIYLPVIRRNQVHEVKPKETLSALSRQYVVSLDSLQKFNPGSISGLKVGQKISIPNGIVAVSLDQAPAVQPISAMNAPAPSRYISFTDSVLTYRVMPNESLSTISKRYMIPVEKLMEFNHLSSSKLKPDQVLKIPLKKERIEAVDQRSVPPKLAVNQLAKAFQFAHQSTCEIAVFLPLNLDSNAHFNRFISTAALDYYMGMKLAIDSLIDLGLSANYHIYDYESDKKPLSSLLALPEMRQMDLIYAPLQKEAAEQVAAFAKPLEIPVVFSVAQPASLTEQSNRFIAYTPDNEALMNALAKHVHQHYNQATVVLIHGETSADLALDAQFIEAFKALPSSVSKLKLIEATWQSYLQYNALGKPIVYIALSSSKERVLPLLKSQLNSPEMTVIGTKDWLEWKEISASTETAYQFVVATPSYFSYHSQNLISFHKKYRRTYSCDMSRMACLGYDATLLIGRMLLEDMPAQQGIFSQLNLQQRTKHLGVQNESAFVLRYQNFELLPDVH